MKLFNIPSNEKKLKLLLFSITYVELDNSVLKEISFPVNCIPKDFRISVNMSIILKNSEHKNCEKLMHIAIMSTLVKN